MSLRTRVFAPAAIGLAVLGVNMDDGNFSLGNMAHAARGASGPEDTSGGGSSQGGQADNSGDRGESTNDDCGCNGDNDGPSRDRDNDDNDRTIFPECGVEIIRATDGHTYFAAISDEVTERERRTLIGALPAVTTQQGKYNSTGSSQWVDLSPALGHDEEDRVRDVASDFNGHDITLMQCALDQAREFSNERIRGDVELQVRQEGSEARTVLSHTLRR